MSESGGTIRFLPDGAVAAWKCVQQTCTVAYTRLLQVGTTIAAGCIYYCAYSRCKYTKSRYVPRILVSPLPPRR